VALGVGPEFKPQYSKNQTKPLMELGTEGIYLNITKAIYNKLVDHIY
jgi:hypothetical protein